MANEEEGFSIEIRGLEKLIELFKNKPPQLKIGVLGGGRNAEVGAVHEFGAPSKNIPQRSFLRVPLTERLNAALEESDLFNEEALKEVIKTGRMTPWLKRMGVVAEGIVDDAFETSGDGKWPPWKDPHYHNGGGMLLVDTGQLRDSITSEVKE